MLPPKDDIVTREQRQSVKIFVRQYYFLKNLQKVQQKIFKYFKLEKYLPHFIP